VGQYHYLVNLTKKQFVHPHQIGNGLKLHEQVGWPYSTSTVLVMLLAVSSGRGGGDFGEHRLVGLEHGQVERFVKCGGGDFREHRLVGSWAGDRIAFIGDYAEPDDLKGVDAPTVYNQCESGKFKNISAQVRQMMAAEFDIHYTGESWLNIEKGPAPKEGWVEANPLVVFDYPDSKNYGTPRRREVRVIEANEDYVIGLDTLDKNRFKKFKRSRISQWRSTPIWEFTSSPKS